METLDLVNGWRIDCDGPVKVDEPQPVEGSMPPLIPIKFIYVLDDVRLQMIDEIFTFEFFDQNDESVKEHYLDCGTSVVEMVSFLFSPKGKYQCFSSY